MSCDFPCRLPGQQGNQGDWLAADFNHRQTVCGSSAEPSKIALSPAVGGLHRIVAEQNRVSDNVKLPKSAETSPDSKSGTIRGKMSCDWRINSHAGIGVTKRPLQ